MQSILGDKRLDKRLMQIIEHLSENRQAILTQTLPTWASLKAGYRFGNNPKLNHPKLIEVERQATQQRLQTSQVQRILAVQDTTSFNFANRRALTGLGVLDDNRTPGFFAHTTLAVSDQGVPLGILDQQVWVRSKRTTPRNDEYRTRPITEKESYKWLAGLPHLAELEEQIITICDREADVYELFQAAHDHDLDFVVRVYRNRCLAEQPLLRKHLKQGAVAATDEIQVQRQFNPAARTA